MGTAQAVWPVAPPNPLRGKWRPWIPLAVALIVIVALIAGFVYQVSITYGQQHRAARAESALASAQGQVQAAKAATSSQVTTLQGQVSTLQGQTSDLQSQVSGYQDQVSSLQGERAGMLGQISSLKGQVTDLKSKLQHASQQPASAPTSGIPAGGHAFSDGSYVVGTDIQPGTYRASGGGSCYWERLSGFSGNFGDLIANGIGVNQPIVTIQPTDKGFTSERCGTWTPVA
jgi:hypothetical protein